MTAGQLESPTWTTYGPAFQEAYQRFAREQYGAAAYQGSEEYIQWLYCRNQHSRGFPDFLIGALASGEVVGCIHKMRLPWQIRGEVAPVPTLHNLMLKPEYRKGSGFWLLKRSLHKENLVIIPGVVAPFSITYREMKCQAIPSHWLRKVLNPIRLLRRAVAHRLHLGGGAPAPFPEIAVPVPWRGFHYCTRPGREALAELALWLNRSRGEAHVAWTEDLLRWRFFDDRGPRHFLVRSADSAADFFVLSLGIRHGVQFARIMVLACGSGAWSALAGAACRFAREMGADMLGAMTQDSRLLAALAQAGFSRYNPHPETFLFSRIPDCPLDAQFGPEVTDLGLEAFATC